MNTKNYNLLMQNLDYLKLTNIKNNLNSFLKDYNKTLIINFMLKVTEFELKEKKDKLNKSTYYKKLKDFNFEKQDPLIKKEVYELFNLKFIQKKQNIVFLGGESSGKTHLSIALYNRLRNKNHNVCFIPFYLLINDIKDNNKKRIQKYINYDCLIIDNLCNYLLGEKESEDFYHLIRKRNLVKSTIISTRTEYYYWNEIFYNDIIANSILSEFFVNSLSIKLKSPFEAFCLD